MEVTIQEGKDSINVTIEMAEETIFLIIIERSLVN